MDSGSPENSGSRTRRRNTSRQQRAGIRWSSGASRSRTPWTHSIRFPDPGCRGSQGRGRKKSLDDQLVNLLQAEVPAASAVIVEAGCVAGVTEPSGSEYGGRFASFSTVVPCRTVWSVTKGALSCLILGIQPATQFAEINSPVAASGVPKKNRSISREASGPCRSVCEPSRQPPDHACPSPSMAQCSTWGTPLASTITVRV